jgi:glucose-1-phosphate adenylyltransferase
MTPSVQVDPNRVISVIMGGGEGSRLFPLTKERAKPAVPLAGKYRLVDIPISLSISSGIKRIFLLTQYLSSSLHRHVQQSYRFDDYNPRGFIEIQAAQKTRSGMSWYQGTADAVRQNLIHFANHPHDMVLILSGDQLYRMDYRHILAQHVASGADVTVATIPVSREPAKGFGIMQTDSQKKIVRFVEKPKEEALLDSLRLTQPTLGELGGREGEDLFLASMGIYVFNRHVLAEALADEKRQDFGKDIIPTMIQSHKVSAYIYQGYWEDIGTIKAFYEANLDLTEAVPKFDLYDQTSPIYTRARFLPSSKIHESHISRSSIAEGCIINRSQLVHSLVGIRSRIEDGCTIHDSILMGADYFETTRELAENIRLGRPCVGIGKNTVIRRTIVDKNARIGSHVVIDPEGKPKDADHELYHIRDGIVIIPKSAVIPDGFVL